MRKNSASFDLTVLGKNAYVGWEYGDDGALDHVEVEVVGHPDRTFLPHEITKRNYRPCFGHCEYLVREVMGRVNRPAREAPVVDQPKLRPGAFGTGGLRLYTED